MIDPRQLSEEDLQRLLMLLKGQQLQEPMPAPMENDRLAALLRNQRPQVTPGMETATTGVRG